MKRQQKGLVIITNQITQLNQFDSCTERTMHNAVADLFSRPKLLKFAQPTSVVLPTSNKCEIYYNKKRYNAQ